MEEFQQVRKHCRLRMTDGTSSSQTGQHWPGTVANKKNLNEI